MSDQADGLRQLVRERSGATALAEPPEQEPARAVEAPSRAQSLLFTSGKGGVGTSNLALNLAIALGESGQRVVLVDADLGLANIDLLCGLAPHCDLGDVLSGDCSLADALVSGPGDIRIVPGAHGMRTLVDVLGDGPRRLAVELAELEEGADFLLVDAGSGLGPGIMTLAAAAEQVVLVTTPEPTSVADAHAVIGRFRRLSGPSRIRAVVNQAASASEAADVLDRLSASSRQFLGTVVSGLGHVRSDSHVPLAVRLRQPFVLAYPGSMASKGVRRLARELIEERRPSSRRPGFFAAIAARWALSRVAR
ncbi:P-loop NTPase [Singulisphaera sp. PoT]|uniref:P-loop NTPase n=1 Tax=Singulisphaera sp. PoT TaxID=3411797 RepID=UPI003BF5209C